jgi:hypothetical protein
VEEEWQAAPGRGELVRDERDQRARGAGGGAGEPGLGVLAADADAEASAVVCRCRRRARKRCARWRKRTRACCRGPRPRGSPLRDIAYTASVRRSHHEHRLSVVGQTRQEVGEGLAAYLRGEERAGVEAGQRARERGPRWYSCFPGRAGSGWGWGESCWSERRCSGQRWRRVTGRSRAKRAFR